MSKVTLTVFISFIVGVGYPLVQFVGSNHLSMATGWPTVLCGLLALTYSFLKANPAIAGTAFNAITSAAGIAIAVCIAIQPVVATGSLNWSQMLVAAVPAVMMILDGNPNEENVIMGMFAKVGVPGPYSGTGIGSGTGGK